MTQQDLTEDSFRQWLGRQHGARSFSWNSLDTCMIGSWLTEQGICDNPRVGGHIVFDGYGPKGKWKDWITFPAWLMTVSNITAGLSRLHVFSHTIEQFRRQYLLAEVASEVRHIMHHTV